MQVRKIEGFQVTGLAVSTNNADEMNTDTAKIGNLWGEFYAQSDSNTGAELSTYGVYTNYRSDDQADYDVIAGIKHLSTDTSLDEVPSNWVKVTIPSGDYLVFADQGEMPQVVIKLWEKIWQYFRSSDSIYTRTYTSDFECYQQNGVVEIAIAIKPV